jgi:hypothetical protein
MNLNDFPRLKKLAPLMDDFSYFMELVFSEVANVAKKHKHQPTLRVIYNDYMQLDLFKDLKTRRYACVKCNAIYNIEYDLCRKLIINIEGDALNTECLTSE